MAREVSRLEARAQDAPPYRTKQQIAYDILRESILSGELRPGDRLLIEPLGRQLGVSTMPVREAIRRLTADGLVTSEPHAGAVVAPIVVPRVEEIAEIRGALEGLAARLAVPRLADADVAALRDLVDQMDRCLDDVTVGPDFGRLNRTFHHALYGRCDAPFLLDLIDDLRERVAHVRSQFILVPEIAIASQEGHRAILSAVVAGDAAGAEREVRRHLVGAAILVRDTVARGQLPDAVSDVVGGPVNLGGWRTGHV